ncbi:MAG TPA: hypothetical protein DDY78_30220 [Planctomycetales bacterium]|jgi:hypothetical protein|nr:hypothetical protein [Planctomycetales bacterium]
MKEIVPLGERLAPDTIAKLERAAQHRFATAEILRTKKRRLAALYLYGYSAEICLSAAYYRSSGLPGNTAIDRDTRQRRMAQARQLRTASGEPLMNSAPHPLVGWARFLQWQRILRGGLTRQDERRLREAINKATLIYNYWRPELRYKTVEVPDRPLQEVQRAAKWLLDNQKQL